MTGLADVNDVEGVLVVGGGAVGLTTALSLAQKGVPVTVLEAEPELVREYRGSTFHPPTLEMLDELGVGAPLIEKGVKADRVQFRDRDEGVVAEFDLGALKDHTPYPFRVQIDQYALVDMLFDRLSHMPSAEVLFGHRVTNVIRDEGRATVTAETPDGRRGLRASYVVGADGSASAVRRSLGIEFKGMTYPNRYLTLFTPFNFATHLPGFASVNYISDAREWTIMLRSPDVWRVLFPIRPGQTDEEALDAEAVEARLQEIVATGDPYPVVYCRVYRVHQRVAATYRQGPALLAGDAAHVNNPVGGMGLNGGIHDAVDLSGRLARVWHGEAGAELLDGYATGRKAVAIDHVQAQSHENALAIGEGGPEARERQKKRLVEIAADPEKTLQYLLRTSMIASVRASRAGGRGT